MEHEIAIQLILGYLPLVVGMMLGLTLGPIIVFWPNLLLQAFHMTTPCKNLPRGFGFVGIGLIVVGLWSLLLICMSPSPWNQYNVMKQVLTASADEITSVEIIPWGFRAGDDTSEKPLVIRNDVHLRQLCNCLSKSQSWNLGGVGNTRNYKLRLYRATGKDTCLIENAGNGTVLLVIYNHDEGWLTIGNPIGTFRCDALGPLVDSWRQKNNSNGTL